jgi:hypothetical protein
MCYESFIVTCNLMRHPRIHSAELPHSSGVCHKLFSVLSILKSSVLALYEYPFTSHVCSRLFTKQDNVKSCLGIIGLSGSLHYV